MKDYLGRISNYESEEQYNKRKVECHRQQKIKSVTNYIGYSNIHHNAFDIIRLKN